MASEEFSACHTHRIPHSPVQTPADNSLHWNETSENIFKKRLFQALSSKEFSAKRPQKKSLEVIKAACCRVAPVTEPTSVGDSWTVSWEKNGWVQGKWSRAGGHTHRGGGLSVSLSQRGWMQVTGKLWSESTASFGRLKPACTPRGQRSNWLIDTEESCWELTFGKRARWNWKINKERETDKHSKKGFNQRAAVEPLAHVTPKSRPVYPVADSWVEAAMT